jgi:hypothetical protein
MEILLGIIILVLFGVIIYFAKRPPQVIEKTVERVIQADAEAEEKLKFEQYYRIKQKELDEKLAEEQKNRYVEIQE